MTAPASDRRFDLVDPATYRHWVTDTVRFSDQDAQGHVNNVAVAAWVETGRVTHGHDLVMPWMGPDEGVVLAHLAIDYRRQSHFPGRVDIGSRVVRVGTSSYALASGLFRDGECVATAESVLVHLVGGRSASIEGRLRDRLGELLAE